MLELQSPEGAFEQIEEYLRDRGFFSAGGEDLVADLYLGYGLSEPLRRSGLPPPPEPCPLPLAAVSLRDTSRALSPGRVRIGQWDRSWSDDEYAAAVEEVREAIARGDVYQVNLVQHLSAPFEGDPRGLSARSRSSGRLRRSSPATGGRSRRPRRSSSSRAAAGACGRCRSRARVRSASTSRARRTRPSTR